MARDKTLVEDKAGPDCGKPCLDFTLNALGSIE